MNHKKIRNLIAAFGIMAALLPAFLYAAQNAYYGPAFSKATTTAALLCFIGASLVQLFHNKQKGLPINGPLIIAGGFAFLMVYLFISF